ncbi:MAG: hypothetical protein EOM72_12185 [Opitutae bacterium]|nr:hypothetical protein [Opitutae bacterium]
MIYPPDSDIYNANLADLALLNVQLAVKARLRACPWFAPVNVLAVQEGDIVNEIARSLGTMTKGYGLGMCVVIGTPNADDSTDNAAAIDLDPFYIAVDVYCDPLTVNGANGVKRTMEGTALNALRLLKGWTPAGMRGPLAANRPTLSTLPDAGNTGILIKRVNLRGALALPVLRLEGEGLFPEETV